MTSALKDSNLTLIHPTAVIDPAAELDSTVTVGPFVIIEGPVRVGPRTRIMARAHISGRTTIGADNEIHIGAVIGHVPQHLQYDGSDTGVVMGDRNTIREYVTIHRAYHPGTSTTIGDGNFLMGLSHVAHDCILENNIIIANGTLLAGHSHVESGAVLSGNVAVHQFVRIGAMAMVGGLAKITKDVPPYMLADGLSVIRGVNIVGMRRSGIDGATRQKIREAYKLLYRSGLSVPSAVQEMERTLGDVPQVRQVIDFIKNSKRGISKHIPDND